MRSNHQQPTALQNTLGLGNYTTSTTPKF